MNATRRLLAQLHQVPNLTLETHGSRLDLRHGGETLATLDQVGSHLDMDVPPQAVPALLARFPAARRTRSGLTVALDDSAAVRTAASLVRMRINKRRFDWQFSHRGP
jgi:hypothetical protein